MKNTDDFGSVVGREPGRLRAAASGDGHSAHVAAAWLTTHPRPPTRSRTPGIRRAKAVRIVTLNRGNDPGQRRHTADLQAMEARLMAAPLCHL
jgi:hypothetical protein